LNFALDDKHSLKQNVSGDLIQQLVVEDFEIKIHDKQKRCIGFHHLRRILQKPLHLSSNDLESIKGPAPRPKS